MSYVHTKPKGSNWALAQGCYVHLENFLIKLNLIKILNLIRSLFFLFLNYELLWNTKCDSFSIYNAAVSEKTFNGDIPTFVHENKTELKLGIMCTVPA